MKCRTGFVSNSSSTSFVLSFINNKPTTLEELKTFLCIQNETQTDESIDHLNTVLWNIKDASYENPKAIKTYLSSNLDIRYMINEMTCSLEEFIDPEEVIDIVFTEKQQIFNCLNQLEKRNDIPKWLIMASYIAMSSWIIDKDCDFQNIEENHRRYNIDSSIHKLLMGEYIHRLEQKGLFNSKKCVKLEYSDDNAYTAKIEEGYLFRKCNRCFAINNH